MPGSASPVVYSRHLKAEVTAELLAECASLFSSSYGTWASDHPNPAKRGRSIRLPPNSLRDYLPDEDAWLVTARIEGKLVGYAMAIWAHRKPGWTISWVTQLVVDQGHRRLGIATSMLTSVWGYSSHAAWGIVSANAFAIRALEKATRRTCAPPDKSDLNAVNDILSHIPYLRSAKQLVSGNQSIVDTRFYQDLSAANENARTVARHGRWRLGALPSGCEWLGVTFQRQKPRDWTAEELQLLLHGARDIAAQAYERMASARPAQSHPWARHASSEVSYLCRKLALSGHERVLDFGCGSGRHAVEFGRRGFQVDGVDASQAMILQAHSTAQELSSDQGRVSFKVHDGLSWQAEHHYDVGICLYDVIGSYPDDGLNEQLFKRFVTAIRPGGRIAISVMSYDYTKSKKPLEANGDAHRRLADLIASDAMESDGEVFDPDHILLDTHSHIAYRKEQFSLGNQPPLELIVADRRYTIHELKGMCRTEGVRIDFIGYVRAGQFEMLDEEHSGAMPTKEILLLGTIESRQLELGSV
jgi:SAM-dependent methyltransferase